MQNVTLAWVLEVLKCNMSLWHWFWTYWNAECDSGICFGGIEMNNVTLALVLEVSK